MKRIHLLASSLALGLTLALFGCDGTTTASCERSELGWCSDYVSYTGSTLGVGSGTPCALDGSKEVKQCDRSRILGGCVDMTSSALGIDKNSPGHTTWYLQTTWIYQSPTIQTAADVMRSCAALPGTTFTPR